MLTINVLRSDIFFINVCSLFSHPLQDYDTTDLIDFEDTIMKGCDFNRDGKISKKELTMILLALAKQAGED